MNLIESYIINGKKCRMQVEDYALHLHHYLFLSIQFRRIDLFYLNLEINELFRSMQQ